MIVLFSRVRVGDLSSIFIRSNTRPFHLPVTPVGTRSVLRRPWIIFPRGTGFCRSQEKQQPPGIASTKAPSVYPFNLCHGLPHCCFWLPFTRYTNVPYFSFTLFFLMALLMALLVFW